MSSPTQRLSEGVLDWLAHNLDYFDPYSSRARSSGHPKVKAALELALLCHCGESVGARDSGLRKLTALVRTLWRSPDFAELVIGHPDYGDRYGLVYVALAPEGASEELRLEMVERLAISSHLSALDHSAYQRLEISYYAEKAGIEHKIGPYADLVEQSPLVRLSSKTPTPTVPLDTEDAYAITHSAFFLTDFGCRLPVLADDVTARATGLVNRMLADYVRRDCWDLAAELVTTQFCLVREVRDRSSELAAVECLAKAQQSDGAIPGRSAAERGPDPVTPAESFENAYHTTLVTAMMSLIVSQGDPSCRFDSR